jgi:hypothetical protein
VAAVMPRTKTLRRNLAQTIRSELGNYRDMVDDHQDRVLLNVLSDIGALARLEGFTAGELAAAISKGYARGG